MKLNATIQAVQIEPGRLAWILGMSLGAILAQAQVGTPATRPPGSVKQTTMRLMRGEPLPPANGSASSVNQPTPLSLPSEPPAPAMAPTSPEETPEGRKRR